MLSSVLFARDKYCPQVIIPDEASLYIVGFYNKFYYHQRLDWTNEEHFGIDLSSVRQDICSEVSNDNCLGYRYEQEEGGGALYQRQHLCEQPSQS